MIHLKFNVLKPTHLIIQILEPNQQNSKLFKTHIAFGTTKLWKARSVRDGMIGGKRDSDWERTLSQSTPLGLSSIRLDMDETSSVCVYISFLFFFFFSEMCFFGFMSHQWVLCTVHGTHKPLFSATFSLKMGPTALFTHLKIILRQCFQFLAK